MCRFIESIRIENGHVPLIEYHQQRYEQCIKIHFPDTKPVQLANIANQYLHRPGIFKLRIEYDQIIRDVRCKPYYPRKIRQFRLVYDDNVKYNWKYSNRKALEKLKSKCAEDEEIIIVKNNLITDSSYANLIFYKEPHWFTPAKPLLNGTMRRYLLNQNKIQTMDITPSQLQEFVFFAQINAMLDIETTETHNIKQIIQ
ncbi:MAG: aminotransferase class IV [Bacteroidota bacterium]